MLLLLVADRKTTEGSLLAVDSTIDQAQHLQVDMDTKEEHSLRNS